LVTVNEQLLVLLLASLAVSVIIIFPIPLTDEPIAGDCVTVTGLHASLAVASDV
jgi:hypothetical protein